MLLPGFGATQIASVKSIMTSAWFSVANDSRLTDDKIYKTQSLNKANFENLQNSGQLVPPWGFIAVSSGEDAGDTPANWLSTRVRVTVTYALKLDDPILVSGSGIDLTSTGATLIEITKNGFLLSPGSNGFVCRTILPSTDISEHSPQNHPLYALLDGKFSVSLSAMCLIAQIYDPTNP